MPDSGLAVEGKLIVLTAPLTETIDHAGYFIQMALASLPKRMEGVIDQKYPKWRELERNAQCAIGRNSHEFAASGPAFGACLRRGRHRSMRIPPAGTAIRNPAALRARLRS